MTPEDEKMLDWVEGVTDKFAQTQEKSLPKNEEEK